MTDDLVLSKRWLRKRMKLALEKEPSVFRDWYLAIVAYKIYRRTWRFPKFIMDLFVPFLVRGHPIKVYLEAVKMK